METRASYFLVGLFVLVLAVGTVGFIIWLAGFDRESDTMRYRIIVDGSVTGLTEGSVVRYSGVPVGQVQSIALDPKVPGQVDVVIDVKPDTPVRTDTKVTLELQGLAGGLYVLMSGGTEGAPMLRPVPGAAQYAAPLAGLYLCGAGSHPGGGIMGAPGRIAALELLKEWNR